MSTKIWGRLHKHHQTMQSFDMRQAVKEPLRYHQFSLRACGLLLDYSKNLINEETINLLCQFAEAKGVQKKLKQQILSEKVNYTEKRAVMHTAMRDLINGRPKTAKITQENRVTRERIYKLRADILNKKITGFTGKPIRSVVNLGIGGSYLGPLAVCTALPAAAPAPQCDFLASSSPDAVQAIARKHELETTLFIISSKSFSTQETLDNANYFYNLYKQSVPREKALKHFYAVTAAQDKALAWGVKPEHLFSLPLSVGGRFSLWSAIGLPIIMQLGKTSFEQLLAGAFDMDNHGMREVGRRNMPLVLALLNYWYSIFWHSETFCINVYEHGLRRLPAFLQQLSMESCGKRINMNNEELTVSGEILWGGEGTLIQHSYMQLCHQGTHLIPMDIIFAARPRQSFKKDKVAQKAHLRLQAHALAQSQALLRGRDRKEAARFAQHKGLPKKFIPHLMMPGNRPSNCLLYEELTPYSLGALLSLYEHKTCLFAYLLEINPFDQWGVELGKELSTPLEEQLDGKEMDMPDASTAALIREIRRLH